MSCVVIKQSHIYKESQLKQSQTNTRWKYRVAFRKGTSDQQKVPLGAALEQICQLMYLAGIAKVVADRNTKKNTYRIFQTNPEACNLRFFRLMIKWQSVVKT